MIGPKPCTDTPSFLDLLMRLASELNHRLVEFDIRREKCLVLDEYTAILDPIFSTQESLFSPRVHGSLVQLTAVQSPKLQIRPSAPSLESQTIVQLVFLVGISQYNIASYHTHVVSGATFHPREKIADTLPSSKQHGENRIDEQPPFLLNKFRWFRCGCHRRSDSRLESSPL